MQLYDAFTVNTILFLEDLGFCPKGAETVRLDRATNLPVNPNGGWGLVHAARHVRNFSVDRGVRRLRCECGDR
ncbi:thiolase C-terminal domain-containing protein [Bradyrhizobium mercantei]|uniref:thiolase C-terminal domain-containing protein n=1 Tax=Bradyrhizobium mercantei TaxID=1904807 RepID=UPI00373FCE70